ncbi:MAG: hypothetical protein LAT56_08645 [Wenzhouxiangella sp.]|nr:hypothetical protein [Wenzhouxiangella sp.]
MLRKFLIVFLIVPLLQGCGRGDDETSPAETAAPEAPAAVSASGDVSLFQRIDADTAMLYANLSPMPDEVAALIYASLESISQSQEAGYDEAAEAIAERAPLLAAFVRDLGSIRSAEDLEARGLASNDMWAMHMISVFPVGHWTLSDAAAFDAWLNRLSEEAGTEWPARMIDDERLIWSDLGDFGVAMHHDGQVVTMGLIADDDRLLRRIVNLDQPTEHFQPRDLQAFNQARNLTPYGSGFFEFSRFFAPLLDDADEQTAPVREALNMQRAAVDAACDRELDALFTQIPRFSIGMPRLDRREMSVLMRIETHSELGQRLQPIADTPVGLDMSSPRLMSAGLALNLIAARDFGRELVGGWVNTPPQCALFETIRENAASWQLSLNRPIPPFITSMHGVRVDMERLRMRGLGEGVEDAAGTVALFMRNPQMLLGMAQMFSPELAALNLSPGGEPQRLPSDITDQIGDIPAWIALGQQALGLAVGEGQQNQLKANLEPGSGDDAIMAYGINVPAYLALMAEMTDVGNGLGLDFDFMGLMSDKQEESRISVHLREQGIDIISTSIFRQ